MAALIFALIGTAANATDPATVDIDGEVVP